MIMTDTIFRKRLGNGDNHPLTLGDLPDDIKPTDEIFINYDPGYYSENNSWDLFTEVFVYRDRLETDEEREKRLADAAKTKAELKERRRKTFLMLK